MHGSVEGVLGDWHSYSDFAHVGCVVRRARLVVNKLINATLESLRDGGADGLDETLRLAHHHA